MKKMNLYLIALISIFSTSSIFAQDYLTKINYESCEFLSAIEETEDRDQFNLELGLCIIEASMPYKKELKKDHNIDLENINEDGTRLGELIGIKMDLGTVVTAAIMLAVCVLPFVLMNQKKQKRIKHLKQTFDKFAEENDRSIGEFDICGEIVIGVDSTSSTLLFIKENGINETKKSIEIKNIASVSIEKVQFNESSNFDTIALNFHLKVNTSKVNQFILFDSNDRMQLVGELQLAEKWQKKIQDLLISKTAKAA